MNFFRMFFEKDDGASAGGATQIQDPPAQQQPPKEPEPPADDGKGKIPYERFKEVNEKKNQAEQELARMKQQQEDAEKKKLEEQGKFQDLAKKAEKEKNEAIEKAQKAEAEKNQKAIEFEIGLEAKNEGIADVKDAVKLIDLKDITVNDDGTISGVKEAVTNLKKEKPYLFNSKAPGVHTDHAKSPNGMTKEELLKDPVSLTKLKQTDPAEYKRIMGKK